MASLQYAKESIVLKVLQDVADDDKRTQTLELTSSVVWKGKSAAMTASLADALLENTKVTALNLSDCNIGDNGLISLADSIKENGTVRKAFPLLRARTCFCHRHRAFSHFAPGSYTSSTCRTTNLAAPG